MHSKAPTPEHKEDEKRQDDREGSYSDDEASPPGRTPAIALRQGRVRGDNIRPSRTGPNHFALTGGEGQVRFLWEESYSGGRLKSKFHSPYLCVASKPRPPDPHRASKGWEIDRRMHQLSRISGNLRLATAKRRGIKDRVGFT